MPHAAYKHTNKTDSIQVNQHTLCDILAQNYPTKIFDIGFRKILCSI
jgi:hypothetical protein